MSTNTVRHLPRHVIVSRLRDVRVTQQMIGDRVGVSHSFVNRVIARRAVVRPSVKSEAVWREIEKALAGYERRAS